jgi:hypothetical protein
MTQDPEDDLTEQAGRLDETPAADRAFALGLAGLQLVPLIGPVMATFISEVVPRRKQARLVGFVQDLTREFEAEHERIDSEFVRTDEFDRMVEDVLERVQTVKNEDKLGFWAALLAGVAASDRPKKSDRDRMIETLDGLRTDNLRLLHVIATTSEGPPGIIAGGVGTTLEWKLPDVPNDEARRLWAELTAAGLVGGYPSGTMTAQGMGMLVAHLTPYGRELVRLLRLEAGFGE